MNAISAPEPHITKPTHLILMLSTTRTSRIPNAVKKSEKSIVDLLPIASDTITPINRPTEAPKRIAYCIAVTSCCDSQRRSPLKLAKVMI